MDHLKKLIREVPDWPKPGILFYDLTTLVANPGGLRTVVESLAELYGNSNIDVVAGIEARGFILAPAVALRLGTGFVPIRKPKKLPWKTSRVTYDLEYGTDTLEIHQDAVHHGQRVLLIDDLLATGGTAAAATALIRQLGGEVAAAAFIVELTFLNGRQKLQNLQVHSLLQYDS